MINRLENFEDHLNGVVTYDLGDGKRLRVARSAVEEVGLAEILRRYGYEHLIPTERVKVMWCGRMAGTVTGDFDPLFIKSKDWLYSPRAGDFIRDGDVWQASNRLGPGDLEAVPGFRWERQDG